MSDAFQARGYNAWRRGLSEAVSATRREVEAATSAEEREALKERLRRLEREQKEAASHGRRWLF
jgi:hypothetical protein